MLTTIGPDAPPHPQSTTGGIPPKKATLALKAPFPDAHISVVVNKIDQLHASSLSALVEAIYLELREHKVTKVAIEAKIKEVGEKCREKKIWVVKPVSKVCMSVFKRQSSSSVVLHSRLLDLVRKRLSCHLLIHYYTRRKTQIFLDLIYIRNNVVQ